MLKKINASHVVSDSGFSVKLSHPGDCCEYWDGDKYAGFGLGYDAKKRAVHVGVSTVTTWLKPVNQLISNSEREEIILNMTEALKLLTENFIID